MAAVELFFSFSFSLNPALVLVLHSLTLVHFHFVSHVFGLVSSYKHRRVWGNFWCRPRIPHRVNCEGVKHEGRQKVNVEVDSSPHTPTALSQRPDNLRYWNTIQFFIFQLFPFGASHPVRCEDAHQPSSFPPAWCIHRPFDCIAVIRTFELSPELSSSILSHCPHVSLSSFNYFFFFDKSVSTFTS